MLLLSLLGLPADVMLRVIYFLPIRQVLLLQLCSYQWYDSIHHHEPDIYRSAAILHSFAKPSHSLAYLKKTLRYFPPKPLTHEKTFVSRFYRILGVVIPRAGGFAMSAQLSYESAMDWEVSHAT